MKRKNATYKQTTIDTMGESAYPALYITMTSLLQKARTVLAAALICAVTTVGSEAYAQQVPPPPPDAPYAQLGYEQLGQLVAPIALYPDALVAQVLAGATYPNQIVEADRFVAANITLPPQERARIVDSQPWDPAVKALTAFPAVLSNMARNLDWTSRLGNAYYNQPQDVMGAVQTMRQRAYEAGTLRSSPELSVGYAPGYIVVQPVNPALVYVPVYNPWVVYGAPVPVYPAYAYVAPVAPFGGVAVSFGFSVGVPIGAFASFSWGYASWSPNWVSHTVVYNHTTYVSRSVTVVNHGYYGYYDHSPVARSYNRQVVAGPNGVSTRTAVRGPNNTNVYGTGSNGGAYDRNTHFYPGGNSTTVTTSNGSTATRTVNGRGTGDVTATAVGPNGGTTTRNTQTFAGGNTTSVTRPDDQTSSRTITGVGTNNVTATTTGPNGGTTTRNTQTFAGGNTTTVTKPDGQTGSRTVTGLGTGNVNAVSTGPNGGSVDRQTTSGPNGSTTSVTKTNSKGQSRSRSWKSNREPR